MNPVIWQVLQDKTHNQFFGGILKMKKFLIYITILVVALLFAMPTQAAVRHFELSVYKATASNQLDDPQKATLLTDDVSYSVFAYSSTTVKSSTRESLFSDNGVTSLGQDPWVAETTFESTDSIDFYCDPTESSDATVRLLVVDKANGYSTWADVTYNIDHTIIINEVPGILHVLTIPFWSDKDTGTDTAVDTGVDLHPSVLLVDAYIDVHVVTTTAGTIDVGSTDSTNAYISGLATSSLGFVQDDVFDTAMQFLTFAAGVDDRSIKYVQRDPDPTQSADGLINILFIEQ